MRYYISGKITNNPTYKEDFRAAETLLQAQGHDVINPAKIDYALTYAEYMKIDLILLGMCDGVYMLANWTQSEGAKTELSVAQSLKKQIRFER